MSGRRQRAGVIVGGVLDLMRSTFGALAWYAKQSILPKIVLLTLLGTGVTAAAATGLL